MLNSYTFFILPNRFLPLWNQRKRARGPAGNRCSPLSFEHHSATTTPLHHRDFSISPTPFHSLLSQLTLRLFKGLGPKARNRFTLLIKALRTTALTTIPRWQRLSAFSFFTLLNPLFSLWNRLKKSSGPSRESSLVHQFRAPQPCPLLYPGSCVWLILFNST